MAVNKIYKDASNYEAKLRRVMERLGVLQFDYDWGRQGGFVEFVYKGLPYRFDHTVEKAQQHGVKLTCGSDCFAQIVLALEDFARMKQRGIYDLAQLLAGFKALPAAPAPVPPCLAALNFTAIPSAAELDARYKALARVYHPDAGGDSAEFTRLSENYREAMKLCSP